MKKTKETKKIKKGLVNYPVGDFLIQVKNAVMSDKKQIVVRQTKYAHEVAKTLKRAGFFDEVTKDSDFLIIKITFKNKKPLIMDLKLISRPGLRIYMNTSEIESEKGPEVLILSTNKGILTSKEAIKAQVGGEVIAKII